MTRNDQSSPLPNEELFDLLKQKFPNIDGWKTIETALVAGENTPENFAKHFEKAGLPREIADNVGHIVHNNFCLADLDRILNATGFHNIDGWKTIETALETGENTPEDFAKQFEKAGLSAEIAAFIGQIVDNNFRLADLDRILNATGTAAAARTTPTPQPGKSVTSTISSASTANTLNTPTSPTHEPGELRAPTTEELVDVIDKLETANRDTADERDRYRALLYGSGLMIGIALIFTGFEVGAGSRHGGTALCLFVIGVLLAWYCTRLMSKHLPRGGVKHDD